MKTLKHKGQFIGPNAVTQIIAAARELRLGDQLERIFVSASAYDWLNAPPTEMVDEARVALLHRAVRANLSAADSLAVLQRAGELTGAHILTNRIPIVAQALLQLLPKRLAAIILTKAILAYGATFGGLGEVTTSSENEIRFAIADNPLCRHEVSHQPLCIWHEAVLTTLYRKLVSPDAKAKEVECLAFEGRACIFKISY